MKIPQTNPHAAGHRRAGTIHIVDVDADLNQLLAAIEFELERCGAPALVVDLLGDLPLTPGAAIRLKQVLADPRLDGRWEINVKPVAAPVDGT